MARFALQEGSEHPARLATVRQKPLENQGVKLLRLEFEIFRLWEGNKLKSTGMIASRDLAIGERGELVGDGGVQRYVKALHVKHAANINAWLNLEQRKPWVLIEFGPRSPVDHRNSFAALLPFDPARFQILDYPYDLSLDWVKTGEAAKALRCSENTIRRLVSKHEPVHGSELVRRTAGNQRSINLKLLRNLLPDE